ncbi:Uncharacterised protein [Klebsiella pneumoniae]|uniref:hypothetical protein n=1 Tax=Acinetobacter baumannii TaxID=470 RepID=UPI00094D7ACA|nr:hypothetical protein [Acinetobacter baumannii]PNH14142.1 hypothetical protein DSM30011_013580 [Acinetobacter baumannii]UMO41834.1 hypothetical protein L2Z44_11460 [Acinetobacter baumannii]SSW83650.1 Uncharacterised protein [Klebsiella pneumoniae]
MSNSSIKEILSILENIKKLPTIYPKSGMHTARVRLPNKTQEVQWNHQLSIIGRFKIYFSEFGECIDDETINSFLNNLKEAELYSKEINEIKDFEQQGKYNNIFNNLVESLEQTFNQIKNAKINKNKISIRSTKEFKDFFEMICLINGLKYDESFIQPFIEENSVELLTEIVQKTIDTSNQKKPDNNILLDILKIYRDYIFVRVRDDKNKIKQEYDYLKTERIKFETDKDKALEEVELAKSKLIITAFKNKSETMKDYLHILYFLISLVFLSIITSVFVRMVTKHEIGSNFDISSFIYFISFIVSLTALLTFLIREKNNLSTQRDYFERCDTELRALTTYVVGLPQDKIDNLKIELAKQYFTAGSNQINKGSNQDISLTPENFKQVLDILKEVSKK